MMHNRFSSVQEVKSKILGHVSEQKSSEADKCQCPIPLPLQLLHCILSFSNFLVWTCLLYLPYTFLISTLYLSRRNQE